MKSPNTVKSELTIEDVMALAEYHWTMFKSIPTDMYDKKNAAGTTMKDIAEKYKKKHRYWSNLIDETWPK